MKRNEWRRAASGRELLLIYTLLSNIEKLKPEVEIGMSVKLQKSKGSVWDDIASDPAEAALLKIKAALIDAIRAHIEEYKLTQQEAAEQMGVQRSIIGDIISGKISDFSIDFLVLMAERAGINPLKIAD